jgi:hypothetical protein
MSETNRCGFRDAVQQGIELVPVRLTANGHTCTMMIEPRMTLHLLLTAPSSAK